MMKRMGFALVCVVLTFGQVASSSAVATPRNYRMGGVGPAGGWIFYDKGRVINGWRYLEAAPLEAEFIGLQWGSYQKTVSGTATEVGMGKRNTDLIVNFLKRNGEINRAAQICNELDMGGYDDWFLPSKDELDLMYKNLKAKGLGKFDDAWYWSSSEYTDTLAWAQNFVDGQQSSNFEFVRNRVRAVRAF
jgi:hypothetical protein